MGMEAFKFAGKTLYGHTEVWLVSFPHEKLAPGYTTNAKIYAVRDIMKGVFGIYSTRSPAARKLWSDT